MATLNLGIKVGSHVNAQKTSSGSSVVVGPLGSNEYAILQVSHYNNEGTARNFSAGYNSNPQIPTSQGIIFNESAADGVVKTYQAIYLGPGQSLHVNHGSSNQSTNVTGVRLINTQ